MSEDPLAQYRKTPATPSNPTKPEEPEAYLAFSAKDSSLFLEIRRAMAPYHSPEYRYYLNISFDGPFATNFVLYFSFMTVTVRGRNLKDVIFAIRNHKAIYIQQFDPDRWQVPADKNAPFIESIEIYVQGSNPDTQNESPTTH